MKANPEIRYSPLLQAQKNICVDFMQAYQDQDVEKMLRLSHPESGVQFLPLGSDGKGKIHTLGKNIWSSLIQCFPDINNTVHSMSIEDNGITCKVSIRGTQHEVFFGIPNRGASFDCEHIFVFSLNNKHEIEHLTISWDHNEFVTQLGGQ